MDKFVQHYSNPDNVAELSQYVHENFKVISTKMLSEMRRKLDITPDLQNSEGYVSLMVTLQGRLFNEMVYSLCGTCQACDMKLEDILPINTLVILVNLLQGKNILNGMPRNDVIIDSEVSRKYYLEQIVALRECVEALPK